MLTLITLQKSSLLSKPGFHMISSPISSPSPRVKLEAEKKQREIEERERRKIYAEMEEERKNSSKEEGTTPGERRIESDNDEEKEDQGEKGSVSATDGAISQHQTEENLQDITQVRENLVQIHTQQNVCKHSSSYAHDTKDNENVWCPWKSFLKNDFFPKSESPTNKQMNRPRQSIIYHFYFLN